MITGPNNPTQNISRKSRDSVWPLRNSMGLTFAQVKARQERIEADHKNALDASWGLHGAS